MSDSGRREMAGEGQARGLNKAVLTGPLEYGLAILACFDSERHVLTLTDIADLIGTTCPAAHAYLRALLELGYLRQDSENRYLLGPRSGTTGPASGAVSLREHAQPYLRDLHEQTGLSTGLSILDGEEILYLERFGSHQACWKTPDRQIGPGSRLPAYCTAAGKLLLAYLPEGERTTVTGKIIFTRHGPSSRERRQIFLGELGEIAEEGLAINDEELAPFVQAIAVPIRDHTGEVQAALSLIGSQNEVSIQMLLVKYRAALRGTAEVISSRLGYRL